MSAHTPGPWSLGSSFPDIDGYKVRGGSLAFRKGPRLIAVVKNQGERPIAEDSLSDARLIAAAPELLEALKFVLDHIDDPERDYRDLYPAFGLDAHRAIEMVRTAIAKAEGKS